MSKRMTRCIPNPMHVGVRELARRERSRGVPPGAICPAGVSLLADTTTGRPLRRRFFRPPAAGHDQQKNSNSAENCRPSPHHQRRRKRKRIESHGQAHPQRILRIVVDCAVRAAGNVPHPLRHFLFGTRLVADIFLCEILLPAHGVPENKSRTINRPAREARSSASSST